MNLRTAYMGLNLKNPVIAASSPVSKTIDDIRRAADAGVAAVVMFSLFAEQLTFGSETPYLPDAYSVDPEAYLALLQKAVEQAGIPVIGSLNGVTNEGWVSYAKEIEQAGAAALELNIYHVAADPDETGATIEARHLEILKAVKHAVRIPVALKLSPYFSSLGNMAEQFDSAGASALVLFNRFYQPDFNLEAMEIEATLDLSSASETRLPLRWIAMLRGKIKASLAASIGVQTGHEIVKYLLAGADAVQTASALLRNGPAYAEVLIRQLQEWMELNQYHSVEEFKGSMSQRAVPNPNEFERANYIKVIEAYRPS